jgi:hypothetical protein
VAGPLKNLVEIFSVPSLVDIAVSEQISLLIPTPSFASIRVGAGCILHGGYGSDEFVSDIRPTKRMSLRSGKGEYKHGKARTIDKSTELGRLVTSCKLARSNSGDSLAIRSALRGSRQIDHAANSHSVGVPVAARGGKSTIG